MQAIRGILNKSNKRFRLINFSVYFKLVDQKLNVAYFAHGLKGTLRF